MSKIKIIKDCAHCKGTGSCSCGEKILHTVITASAIIERQSMKEALGIKCLCLGVCDSCYGKGFHIIKIDKKGVKNDNRIS